MIITVTTPYLVGKRQVKEVRVRDLSFQELSKIARETRAQVTADRPFEGMFRTARMLAQAKLFFDDGTDVPLTFILAHAMPIPVAIKLAKVIEQDGTEPGEILHMGDAIGEPVLYKLGTPIKAADGKEISELEFSAKTYGDIENVMGEVGAVDQTLALIRYTAKPVGMLQLPSWALELITVPDGMMILQKVLPRFLPPDEVSDSASESTLTTVTAETLVH